MADYHMEDWSLQAIVRGSTGDFGKMVLHHHQQFDLTSFLEGSADELEELYKPFYPATTTSFPLPDQAVLNFQEQNVADRSAVYTPKYKKRKNQQKRVVIQVSAEGLSSDMWAWRKYGQKPIKGSPFPRSYYRCSSSKVCLARKQVEQSCRDPGMFIVTYTAEHSHTPPTRRNSLAGTLRHKRNPSPLSCGMKSKPTASEGENDEFMMSDFIFNQDFFSGLQEFDEFASPHQFP